VVDNICKTIIGNSNRNEKKKNMKRRRGGRVVRVRRGSDGFVKSMQMDQQHRNDLSTEEAVAIKKKNTHIALCKSRLKYIRNLHSMDKYDDIWNDDTTIQLQTLKKKNLTNLLRIFNVQGRAKLLNNDPMKAALSALVITRASIDLLKANLLQQLEEYGETYSPDGDALDSSFAADSIADISVVDTIVEDSIIDLNISLVTSNDENSIGVFLESETSAGDAGSGSETDDTAELISNLPRIKTVSFNPTPSVRTFSGQVATIATATTSSYPSSSLDDEEASREAETVAAAASAATSYSSSSLVSIGSYSPRITTRHTAAATSSSSSSSSDEEERHSQRVARTRSRNKRTTTHSRSLRSHNRRPTRNKTAPLSRQRSTCNQTAKAITTSTTLPEAGVSEEENIPPPLSPPPLPPAQPASKPVVLRRSSRRR
jgi:hypothetical protein